MPDLKPDDVTFHEETDSPTYADDRMFYKVEKWMRDGTMVDSLLYAGNSLGRISSPAGMLRVSCFHRSPEIGAPSAGQNTPGARGSIWGDFPVP